MPGTRTVLVRADASGLIGAGHVMRTLAIADELARRRFLVTFLSAEIPAEIRDALVARHHRVASSPYDDQPAAWRQILGARSDWVIVDHYQIGADWERNARNLATEIAVIDDLGDRTHDASLLVDHSPDATVEKYRGLVPSSATLLLGPRYALLRREFLATRGSIDAVRPRVGTVVVSMGGSDAGSATGLAVRAALESLPGAEVHVVAGPANPGDLSSPDDRVTVHRSPPDMAALLRSADIVIGSAGTSALERACLGIPSIVLVVADNQLAVATGLGSSGVAENLGWAGRVTEEQLSEALRAIAEDPARRQAMRDAGMRLVDGQGATRVANYIDGVRLRPARWSDSVRILEWANDPDTRQQSLSQEPIDESTHQRWLRANLADPSVDLLIAENGLGPVGVLRLAPGWHDRMEVSINVAPTQRGGLGTIMLRAAMRRWDERLADQELFARIKPGNVASERAFSHVGFQARRRRRQCSRVFEAIGDGKTWSPGTQRGGASVTAPFVFVIAEAGSNWRMGSAERDLEMARRLIDVAAEAGADAVKFQTYRAKSVYVENAGTSDYLAAGGEERSINDIFEDLEMPYDMIPRLAEYTRGAGLEFMSTPFSIEDFAAVDPYVRRHKIASYEVCHVRLIQAAAKTGKPMIMSTGAALPDDIEFGVDTAQEAGARDITLLQCTASYPALTESLNLRVIPWLMDRFGVAAGLSDHSVDPVLAPTVAVALGATVVEKHFTLDRRLPGPDHPFALEPDELLGMVQAIRSATAALGEPTKTITEAEGELRAFAVRAIHAIRPINRGEALIEGENIEVLRPGKRVPGLHPRYLNALSGRSAGRDVAAGEGIELGVVDPPLDLGE